MMNVLSSAILQPNWVKSLMASSSNRNDFQAACWNPCQSWLPTFLNALGWVPLFLPNRIEAWVLENWSCGRRGGWVGKADVANHRTFLFLGLAVCWNSVMWVVDTFTEIGNPKAMMVVIRVSNAWKAESVTELPDFGLQNFVMGCQVAYQLFWKRKFIRTV